MTARSEPDRPAAADFQAQTSVLCTTRLYQVNTIKIKRMAGVICGRLGVAGHELSIRLVGSRAIRQLNLAFRQIDKETDVLSFPQIAWQEPCRVQRTSKKPVATDSTPAVLGDLVIALPVAARNALRIGQPLEREVGFLLVHGILHLCGHDHHEARDEARMRLAQRALMRALAGPAGGKPLWAGSVKHKQKRQIHAH